VAEDKDAPSYAAPTITDYGDLLRMTKVVYPFVDNAARQDLSFSSPGAGGAGTGGVLSALSSSPSSAENAGAAGGVPAGGAAAGQGGGAGGAGGSLPFTGFVPGIVAMIGAGFAAAGYGIRRALRRR
jgi:hypothetical protein